MSGFVRGKGELEQRSLTMSGEALANGANMFDSEGDKRITWFSHNCPSLGRGTFTEQFQGIANGRRLVLYFSGIGVGDHN
jgi:hypothetical protein